MRSFWQEMPMLRVLFALLAGIGLEIAATEVFHLNELLVWAAAGIVVIALAALFLISRIKSPTLLYKLKAWNGLAITVAIMAFGYLLTWFYTERNYPNHFGTSILKDNTYVVRITEPPVIRPKVVMAIAEIEEVKTANETKGVTGKILLSFRKDSTITMPVYGDVLLFNAEVEEIAEPKNPGEFNYKRYQGFRNVYHRAYLQTSNYRVIGNSGNFFFSSVYALRDKFLQIIGRYVKGEANFGVAAALLLGYRDYTTGDLLHAYASSGVIHVLSVSGFHVSILFFMLNLFLQKLDERGRKAVIAKAVFIICFIWFYACLTGFSAPVLRSALMFTLLQVGQVWARNKNSYNLITASAVLLLLFNPFLIMDVGFQLSYLAVLGIMYLYLKIYRLAIVKNWLLDKAWMIVAVSLAAQLTTLPLSLYYFHQFPNLFLLSNLIVIPLSELILFVGTALFVFGQIPLVGEVVGWILNALLAGLNAFIFAMDKLPFALIKGISITLTDMLLAYLLLFILCWLSEERKPKLLIASLVIVFGLCSFHSYRVIENAAQKQIVVYAVPHHTAIAFVSGTTVNCHFDTALINQPTLIESKIKPHWWSCGIKEEKELASQSLGFGEMVLFEGKRVLIIDKAPTNFETDKKLKADLLIISGNPDISMADLKKLVEFDQLVFDSSNNYWKLKKWKSECEEAGVSYKDVGTDGAYVSK